MDENEVREDEVQEDKAEVAEDATPETDVEAVEQRTDDYDGLARRLDDVMGKLDGMTEMLGRIESMMGGFVEAGATIREGSSDMDEISEDVIEDTGINDIVDEVVDVVSVDDLDL